MIGSVTVSESKQGLIKARGIVSAPARPLSHTVQLDSKHTEPDYSVPRLKTYRARLVSFDSKHTEPDQCPLTQNIQSQTIVSLDSKHRLQHTEIYDSGLAFRTHLNRFLLLLFFKVITEFLAIVQFHVSYQIMLFLNFFYIRARIMERIPRARCPPLPPKISMPKSYTDSVFQTIGSAHLVLWALGRDGKPHGRRIIRAS